jgi:hypothetical protein
MIGGLVFDRRLLYRAVKRKHALETICRGCFPISYRSSFQVSSNAILSHLYTQRGNYRITTEQNALANKENMQNKRSNNPDMDNQQPRARAAISACPKVVKSGIISQP